MILGTDWTDKLLELSSLICAGESLISLFHWKGLKLQESIKIIRNKIQQLLKHLDIEFFIKYSLYKIVER